MGLLERCQELGLTRDNGTKIDHDAVMLYMLTPWYVRLYNKLKP